MKITNLKVYNFYESLKISGYPVRTINENETDEQLLNRYFKLSNVKSGTGHDNFLKGIVVVFDIEAPQYWWMQAERYHFLEIISSQSKMHCIEKFDIKKQCNKYVSEIIILEVNKLKDEYLENKTKNNFKKLISNIPMGFNLEAGIVTNYLQLKTIYKQRKNHKLIEWTYFCDYIKENCFMFNKIIF